MDLELWKRKSFELIRVQGNSLWTIWGFPFSLSSFLLSFFFPFFPFFSLFFPFFFFPPFLLSLFFKLSFKKCYSLSFKRFLKSRSMKLIAMYVATRKSFVTPKNMFNPCLTLCPILVRPVLFSYPLLVHFYYCYQLAQLLMYYLSFQVSPRVTAALYSFLTGFKDLLNNPLWKYAEKNAEQMGSSSQEKMFKAISALSTTLSCLETVVQIASKQDIFVSIIGHTNTGKSTLTNALLALDLSPCQVEAFTTVPVRFFHDAGAKVPSLKISFASELNSAAAWLQAQIKRRGLETLNQFLDKGFLRDFLKKVEEGYTFKEKYTGSKEASFLPSFLPSLFFFFFFSFCFLLLPFPPSLSLPSFGHSSFPFTSTINFFNQFLQ